MSENSRMRLPERLMWLFAILFLLFGIPMLFVDSDAPDPSTAHLSTLITAAPANRVDSWPPFF